MTSVEHQDLQKKFDKAFYHHRDKVLNFRKNDISYYNDYDLGLWVQSICEFRKDFYKLTPKQIKEIFFILDVEAAHFCSNDIDYVIEIYKYLKILDADRANLNLAHLNWNFNFRTTMRHYQPEQAKAIYKDLIKTNNRSVKAFAYYALGQMYCAFSEKGPFDDPDKGKDKFYKAVSYLQEAAFRYSFPLAYMLLASLLKEDKIKDTDVQNMGNAQLMIEGLMAARSEPWAHSWVRAEIYYKYGMFLDKEGKKEELKQYIIPAVRFGHLSAKAYFDLHFEDIAKLYSNVGLDKGIDIWSANAKNLADEKDKSQSPLSYLLDLKDGKAPKVYSKKKYPVLKKKDIERIFQPLHSLIGCQNVKQQIKNISYLAQAEARRHSKDIILKHSQSYHTAFIGAPGTGKTTVANLYGDILRDLGILKKGHVVQASRADFIGEYIGQTALKVRDIIKKAKDGILFIDEAYSLVYEDLKRDYGREAIAELLIQMENHVDDLVIVFAGYSKEMEGFFRFNPGLRSRIPFHIYFEDYSFEELVHIFSYLCDVSGMKVSEDALNVILKVLRNEGAEAILKKGNGRYIRNLFERSVMEQSKRIIDQNIRTKKGMVTIEAQDIVFEDDPGRGILKVVR